MMTLAGNTPFRAAMLFAALAFSEVLRLGLSAAPEKDALDYLSVNIGPILLYALLLSAVLGWLASRSDWPRVRLFVVLSASLYIVQTALSYIEVVIFKNDLPFAPADIESMLCAGFFSAVVAAAAPVLLFAGANARSRNNDGPKRRAGVLSWIFRIAGAAVIYAMLYFLAGIFVVWPHEYAREYYQFAEEMNTLALFGFQIARGAVWAGIAVALLAMQTGSYWERLNVTGAALAIFMATLLLAEQPFMPPELRILHIIEISLSNFFFGIFGGGLLLSLIRR